MTSLFDDSADVVGETDPLSDLTDVDELYPSADPLVDPPSDPLVDSTAGEVVEAEPAVEEEPAAEEATPDDTSPPDDWFLLGN